MTHILYPLVQPVRISDYSLDVARSLQAGQTILSKFGANPSVGTTIAPITPVGVYQTPTALTSLELVSSSADDTSAGTGARTVYVQGLSTGYALTEETVSMNGTTAVALANQYFRVFRWYVATSGTYATSAASSHAGTLTLRVAAAGATWDTIGLVDSLGKGQSQIACYTVPTGKTLYMFGFDYSVDTTKAANIYLFKRENADDVSSPYSAMRVQREYAGAYGFGAIRFPYPIAYPAKTDVGFMGETTSGTAAVSIQFEGVLVDA